MKTEVPFNNSVEESNNGQLLRRQTAVEKLLGLCLTIDKLLLLERSIGAADFDQLKQALVGCFVRVPIQGRPMLAAIKSVEESCQIEWARFERRLFLPSLGYFEFAQVDSEMPGQDEIERWCKRREQKALGPICDEFVDSKLALLNSLFNMERGPTQMEPAVHVLICHEIMLIQRKQQNGYETASTSAAAPEFDAGSDQSGDEFEEEGDDASCSIKAEDLPELPNVDGLVQSRELLAQVLLPCEQFLKSFSNQVKNKFISRATAGCLIAFRIADEEGENRNKVIVDEISCVRNCQRAVCFKLGNPPVSWLKLVPVEESEITDQVFDEWLQRLAIRNEPVPDVQDKLTRKMCAIARLAKEAEWVQQIGSGPGKLPDISSIFVTGKEVQLLVNRLELDELNRLLVGCFVKIRIKTFVLELKKQPKMCGLFVVPIARVAIEKTATSTNRNRRKVLYFASKILIRHRETGEPLNAVELHNVGDVKLEGTNKLVVQSLLAMRELNIPLPSDEEIARKSCELSAALVKVTVSSFSSHSTSTSAEPAQQDSNNYEFFFRPPIAAPIPTTATTASSSSSLAAAAISPSSFNFHGSIVANTGGQKQRKMRPSEKLKKRKIAQRKQKINLIKYGGGHDRGQHWRQDQRRQRAHARFCGEAPLRRL